jgi:hypothetical protein
VRAAPNKAMVADRWVSSGGGGGDGNNGGQKCDEGRGGSVACVDERCEGKGAGGESAALGHGRGGRGEKEERRRSAPFMAARWRVRRGKMCNTLIFLRI